MAPPQTAGGPVSSPAVADRDAIVAFLNELLDVDRYPDAMPIGMQVPGAEQVTHVATGVSASLELFQRAAAAGAELVIVHHGLFYGSGPRPAMTAREKARLKALFDADLSLLAYHLCLDAHPAVGNNARICDLLGLRGREPFGDHGAITLGFLAEPEQPLTIDQLVERVREQIAPQPLVFRDGPAAFDRVAVISGAASQVRRRRSRGGRRLLRHRRAERAGDVGGERGRRPPDRRRPLRHRGVRRARAGRPAGRAVRGRAPLRGHPESGLKRVQRSD